MGKEGSILCERSLLTQLQGYAEADPTFWSFREHTAKQNATAYFQYPAMMVPQMQGKILAALLAASPADLDLFDPFVGSGTTLVEGMKLGFRFEGHDINPLAILLCRVKIGPYDAQVIRDASDRVIKRIDEDKKESYEIDYGNREKWYSREALIQLSRFRRAVMAEKELWVRRFLWVCMAEAARLASNTRTTTYKLHIRPGNEISSRESLVLGIIRACLQRNVMLYVANVEGLSKLGCLKGSTYRKRAVVYVRDSRSAVLPASCRKKVDVVVTSPPYGDNNTTVTYGQHSFLPLLWIPESDIGCDVYANYLCTTHEIDRRSLGGSLVDSTTKIETISDLSKSFKDTIAKLPEKPLDARKRLSSFYHDLNESMSVTANRLKRGGFMLWTVGNRRVGGVQVPMNKIVPELFEHHGVKLVHELGREIYTKRMALRNRDAQTMTQETLLVLRKVK